MMIEIIYQQKKVSTVCEVIKCVMSVSTVQTLTTGLSKQIERERHHLETEIKMAADKASHAVQKWYVDLVFSIII